MRALFLSDIHLGDQDDPNFKILCRFLDEQLGQLTHLFLLGDIFDVWVGPHEYYYRKYQGVVDSLRRLRAAGTEIHFFEGNHDFALSGFWDTRVGATVHEGPAHFQLAGLKVRVEHGDQTNPFDLGYIRLRAFLRSGPLDFLIRNTPERFVAFVGETWSPLSRKKKKPYVNEEVKKITHDFAAKLAQYDSFDLMVMGHTHMHEDFSFQVGGKSRRLINLGTWLERPRAFEISDAGTRWLDFVP